LRVEISCVPPVASDQRSSGGLFGHTDFTDITDFSHGFTRLRLGRLRLKIKAKIEFKIKAVGILSDDVFILFEAS